MRILRHTVAKKTFSPPPCCCLLLLAAAVWGDGCASDQCTICVHRKDSVDQDIVSPSMGLPFRMHTGRFSTGAGQCTPIPSIYGVSDYAREGWKKRLVNPVLNPFATSVTLFDMGA